MKKKNNNLRHVAFNVVGVVYRTALVAILLVLCSVYDLSAQATGPCDPFDPQPGCEDYNPDNVPIDGGASLLVAAGVAYGLKKVYDKRKQNKEADVA